MLPKTMTNSSVASATYTIAPKLATPTLYPAPGTYFSEQTIWIESDMTGVTIRYTTDGSTPTQNSPIYDLPIAILSSTTLKVIATAPGFSDSDVVSAEYTIIPKVAMPTFDPYEGTYSSDQSVSLSCETPGSIIKYTIDGTTPNSTSTTYSSPIEITSTTSIKAYATKSGILDSDVATAEYIIDKDTQAPTTPANIQILACTETILLLSWDESIDNVGILSYDIFRNNEIIGNTSTPEYLDTGLTPNTRYSYYIRAVDYNENYSSNSQTVSVITFEKQLPTIPSISQYDDNQLNGTVSWDKSTDNLDFPIAYEIFLHDIKIDETFDTFWSYKSLQEGLKYTYKIRAKDIDDNYSDFCSFTITTPGINSGAPSCPENLCVVSKTDTTITLNWDASTDDSAVAGYLIYEIHNGSRLIGLTAGATTFNVLNLEANTQYSFTVKAIDQADNISLPSNMLNVTTNPLPDNTAPTAPDNLICTTRTDTTISLSWSASTDNIGVTGYNIYNGKTYIGSSSATTYTATGLLPKKTYFFTVKAKDAGGNLSPSSNQISVTTNSSDPTVPANLTCNSKTSATATLSWTAPVDLNNLIGYEVLNQEMRVSEIIGETTCLVDRLLPDQTFTFTVKAIYSDGRTTASSNSVTVTTDPDTTAPAAPLGVYAYSKQDTELTLKWSPSSDDSYIALYEIYRDGTKVGTSGVAEYTDKGLSKTTTYSYKVKAIDAVGNKSGDSAEVRIATLAEDHGNDFATATPVLLEIIEDGSINYSEDVDFFLFKPTVAGQYTIKSSGRTDVYGTLFDGNKKVIMENDNMSQSDKNFTLNINLQENTNYYIKVSGSTGAYGIKVSYLGTVQEPALSGMLKKRAGLGYTTYNNIIYAAGGYNYLNGGILKSLETYDVTTDKWESRSNMNYARWGLGLACANDKIYAAGGTNGGCLNVFEEYDPVADEWITKSPMNVKRTNFGLVSAGGMLYAIGGVNDKGYVSSVEVYDSVSNSWSLVAGLKVPRAGFAVAVIDSKIYVFGGKNNDTSYLDSMEVYDTSTGKWTALETKLPAARAGCSAAVFQNLIYVIGGFNGRYVNSVDIFDPATSTWSPGYSLKEGRTEFGCSSINNRIYLYGGKDSSSDIYADTGTVDFFTFEIKMTAAGDYDFPVEINGVHPNIVVDWGDGATGTITSYSNSSHTYSKAGNYTIRVLSYTGMRLYFSYDKKLTRILTPFPDMKATNFGYCFYYCTSLTTIPSGLFDNNPNVTNFGYCFSRCSALTTIPSGLFDNYPNITDFDNCFSYCSALKTIPGGLFDNNPNVTRFDYCFDYCTSLKAIPSGLFDNNPNVTNFGGCFGGCSSLTAIPSRLFYYNPNVTNFDGCFGGCSSLTTIPSGLFESNSNVVDFSYCFGGCSSLTTIPSGLFESNSNVTDFGYCFGGCSSLTTIPNGLFDSNPNVTNFGYCFDHCSALTTIPSELFDNNLNVTDFSGCFTYCSALTTIPSGLFDNNPNVTNFSRCFFYCSALTTIPSELFDNNPDVTWFDYCFYCCTSLKAIPSGLFDNNPNVTNFGGCFSTCRALTTIPSGLFDNNPNVTSFYECFYLCGSLTTIPSGLFDNNPNVTGFGYCFFVCYSLTTIPSGLFDNNPNVTDFGYCFMGCESLTSIPSGLFDNNPNVTDFSSCFMGCKSLTSIPSGLFDNNTNVASFCDCFDDCSSLTTIPSGLFDNNPNVTDFRLCFYECTSLTTIPSGLFDNNPNAKYFDYCFAGCTKLSGSAPELWLRLPSPSGSACFKYCILLDNYSSIPSSWK